VPTNFETDSYHLKNFEDLLYDSVHMLYMAHDSDKDDTEYKQLHGYKRSYIHCSMLNTVLLFECAANCCIDALDLPGSFADDIDKMPFMSKFEFFLSRINAAAKFDRGCKETQGAAELKWVRDAYVHPKVKKTTYDKVDENTWNTEFGETPILKIRRNPGEWGCSSAVRALKCANDFLNLFFLSWAKLNSNSVCDILLGSDKVTIPGQSGYSIDAVGGLSRAAKEWNIDFRFIGKVV
jgi:hypothetical protein